MSSGVGPLQILALGNLQALVSGPLQIFALDPGNMKYRTFFPIPPAAVLIQT